MIVALVILYIISPVDFIPGFGVGFVDDLISFIWLVWFLKSWLPKNRHRMRWSRTAASSGGGNTGGEDGSAWQAAKSEFDPFDVLNVRRGASTGDITHAYREMLMKYHPDRVAHLGEEFQRLAHEKVIEIRKAYEMLLK